MFKKLEAQFFWGQHEWFNKTICILAMLFPWKWRHHIPLKHHEPLTKKHSIFFFHWHYSPLWALACRKMSFNFFQPATNSLHLLTPSTWRSLSTSSFHLFLGLPLLLVPSSSWVKIFLGILSSSILSRWHNQLILCPFIHFTIFSPLLITYSSRFVWLLHSPFSYLGPYILLNIFLSKISRACSPLFVSIHASAPYDTTGLTSVLYNIILVAMDKSETQHHNTEYLNRQSEGTFLVEPVRKVHKKHYFLSIPTFFLRTETEQF